MFWLGWEKFVAFGEGPLNFEVEIALLLYNCFVISERRRVSKLWPKNFRQSPFLQGVHLRDQELQKFIICLRRFVNF